MLVRVCVCRIESLLSLKGTRLIGDGGGVMMVTAVPRKLHKLFRRACPRDEVRFIDWKTLNDRFADLEGRKGKDEQSRLSGLFRDAKRPGRII